MPDAPTASATFGCPDCGHGRCLHIGRCMVCDCASLCAVLPRLWWRWRLRWGVLSEDGTVYDVGRWRNGQKRHDGALWLAIREWWLLRRHEPGAKVVRRAR